MESDLTADRLTWTLGATIGIKFSKQFAMNKQAQKVKFVATDTAIPNDEEPGGSTTPTTPETPENPGTGGDNTGGGDDDDSGVIS